MADTKISALTAASVAAVANELAINEAGTSKKISITQLKTLLQTLGMPRITRLGTQHSISSTTGTEVTDLSQTLEAGTYTFKYSLILRSATTSVSPLLGINFTGTGAPRMHFRFADASTALTAEIHTMDDEGSNAFGFISGRASNTETTTAPNLGSTATLAVATANTDILAFIEGIIVVTASGDLELWHSSETATATSVEVGSSLVVIRTA